MTVISERSSPERTIEYINNRRAVRTLPVVKEKIMENKQHMVKEKKKDSV